MTMSSTSPSTACNRAPMTLKEMLVQLVKLVGKACVIGTLSCLAATRKLKPTGPYFPACRLQQVMETMHESENPTSDDVEAPTQAKKKDWRLIVLMGAAGSTSVSRRTTLPLAIVWRLVRPNTMYSNYDRRIIVSTFEHYVERQNNFWDILVSERGLEFPKIYAKAKQRSKIRTRARLRGDAGAFDDELLDRVEECKKDFHLKYSATSISGRDSPGRTGCCR